MKKIPDNVIILECDTTLDIPPDRVLSCAEGNVDEVVLVGYDKNGEFYFASSPAAVDRIVFLLEKAKYFVMKNYA